MDDDARPFGGANHVLAVHGITRSPIRRDRGAPGRRRPSRSRTKAVTCHPRASIARSPPHRRRPSPQHQSRSHRPVPPFAAPDAPNGDPGKLTSFDGQPIEIRWAMRHRLGRSARLPDVLDTAALSAAARALGLTQPTVRHRVEALERAIGQPLFVRGVKRIGADARGAGAGRARPAHGPRLRGVPARGEGSGVRSRRSGPPQRLGFRRHRGRAADAGGPAGAPPAPRGRNCSSPTPTPTSPVRRRTWRCAWRGRARTPSWRATSAASRSGSSRRRPTSTGTVSLRPSRTSPGTPMVGPDRIPAYVAILDALSREAGGPLPIVLRSDSHPAQLAAVRAGHGIRRGAGAGRRAGPRARPAGARRVRPRYVDRGA